MERRSVNVSEGSAVKASKGSETAELLSALTPAGGTKRSRREISWWSYQTSAFFELHFQVGRGGGWNVGKLGGCVDPRFEKIRSFREVVKTQHSCYKTGWNCARRGSYCKLVADILLNLSLCVLANQNRAPCIARSTQTSPCTSQKKFPFNHARIRAGSVRVIARKVLNNVKELAPTRPGTISFPH